MKHRKKVLLLIAVAIIVLGVSSTFAYFTIKPLISGEGARTDVSTARVEDTILNLEGSVGFNDKEIYPGHQNISKLKLTATGENKVVYNLEWNGTNSLNTSIEYKVYKTTSEINASITCNKIKDTVDGLMYYYEECTNSNVNSLGEVVASGVIPSKLSSSGIRLIKNEEIQATKSGEIVYYYVVLEFPNKDEVQNYDINGTVNGKVTIEIVNEDIICKTYNANTALGEIAVNDCASGTKINFTEEYKNELRTMGYNPDSNFALVVNYTENDGSNYVRATSGDVYTSTYQGTDLVDFYGLFVDGSILDHYVGHGGEWNAEYEECYFNGETVYSIATSNSTFTEEECNSMDIYEDNGHMWGETYVGGELRKVGTIEYTSKDGIYAAEDDEGTSYYYYGDSANNFVKFGKYPDTTPDVYVGYYSATSSSYKEYTSLSACQSATSFNYNCTKIRGAGEDMYWRIVRVNGDGTIRLIYNGITTDQTGPGTRIGTSAFNINQNDNAYVGYMYGKTGASTYKDTHTNTNSSTIKTYLDNWYAKNLANYDSYIDKNAGFCGDRSVNTTDTSWSSNDTKLGYNKNVTLYASNNRLRSIYIPTYKCLNKNNDLYTTQNSNRGNKAITYPIGLITIDEALYSGIARYISSWLTTGGSNWTMSPDSFAGGAAYVLSVHGDGGVFSSNVISTDGVRPVINLKPDVEITGNGSKETPFVVS